MNRYVCVHGHFYQPPRENPWLEQVERQDSAHPYHDWNARITAECYGPNGASRILDHEHRIKAIVNNYSSISFDFGPTLLSWLERHAVPTYQRILQADAESRKRFEGHGSALAQAYNHMIMPLANARDKETQIIWGIEDFKWRFGRAPEGMWLPETACNLETLQLLARHGVFFTVLAPSQAQSVRPIGSEQWQDVSDGNIDPSRAYVQKLPDGLQMALFFYDGPISQAVAFQRLLADGQTFASRLLSGLSEDRTWPQLAHIATDGESYGHHHEFGDMALAFALDQIEQQHHVELINYGAFLERHPPSHEVQIRENSSWSCVHGVERWRADCGCHSGGHPQWNQAWRQPLREAMDWLRDQLAVRFEQEAAGLLADPWQARNEYIRVILNRSEQSVEGFLELHAAPGLSESVRVRALELLEMQRHAMLMYTSCGWFFDEVSGIESVQVIQYAGRAIQLAGPGTEQELESGFLARLEKARSNLPEKKDGRLIYEQAVIPARIDLVKVGSHFAVSTLYEEYQETAPIYCYEVHQEEHESHDSGATRLSLGRARVRSLITRESLPIEYAALHLGGHNLAGGARPALGGEAYDQLRREAKETFGRMEIPGLVKFVDHHFGDHTFSLRTLFRDEQQKYIGRVLAGALESAEDAFIAVYRNSAPVMQFLAGLGIEAPAPLRLAADRALNHLLQAEMEAEGLNVTAIRRLLESVREGNVQLDKNELTYAFQSKLERMAELWHAQPWDLNGMRQLVDGVELTSSLPFKVNLWQVQNVFDQLRSSHLKLAHQRAMTRDSAAARWLENFKTLADLLWMRQD